MVLTWIQIYNRACTKASFWAFICQTSFSMIHHLQFKWFILNTFISLFKDLIMWCLFSPFPPPCLSLGPLLCVHQLERTVEEHRLPRQPVIRRAPVWQPRLRWMVSLHRHGRGCHAHLLHLRESVWHTRPHLAQWQPPKAPWGHHHPACLRQLQQQLLPVERQRGCEGLSWRILCVPPAKAVSLLPCVLWPWVSTSDVTSVGSWDAFFSSLTLLFLCVAKISTIFAMRPTARVPRVRSLTAAAPLEMSWDQTDKHAWVRHAEREEVEETDKLCNRQR